MNALLYRLGWSPLNFWSYLTLLLLSENASASNDGKFNTEKIETTLTLGRVDVALVCCVVVDGADSTNI